MLSMEPTSLARSELCIGKTPPIASRSRMSSLAVSASLSSASSRSSCHLGYMSSSLIRSSNELFILIWPFLIQGTRFKIRDSLSLRVECSTATRFGMRCPGFHSPLANFNSTILSTTFLINA